MVDIHTHILPGIDDGARDWEDAYRMAAIAADSGVDTIVCTHHANVPNLYQNYDSRYLDQLFAELKDRLRRGGFPLRILRGMEIFSTDDVVEKIMAGILLPLHNTDYYLIEFDFYEAPDFMEDIISGIMEIGKRPIIAHPERYICLQDEPEILHYWMTKGLLTQVNRGSLQGNFGSECESAARTFIDHHMVTCLASDAHRPDERSTEMGRIFRQVSREYSEILARQLLSENPRRILQGRRVIHRNLVPFKKDDHID